MIGWWAGQVRSEQHAGPAADVGRLRRVEGLVGPGHPPRPLGPGPARYTASGAGQVTVLACMAVTRMRSARPGALRSRSVAVTLPETPIAPAHASLPRFAAEQSSSIRDGSCAPGVARSRSDFCRLGLATQKSVERQRAGAENASRGECGLTL